MKNNPETVKQYRREKKERRITEARYLLGSKCIRCSTRKSLHFDHVDPATKLFNISDGADHVSEARFWAEVAKCQLLCKPHHLEKTAKEQSNDLKRRRQSSPTSKLRDLDVLYIHGLYGLGHSQRAIAREFEVHPSTINRIVNGTERRFIAP